jgi:hypothetical protein
MQVRPPLTRLLNSTLFVDSIYRPGEWKRVEDLTTEERERGEAWRRSRDRLAEHFQCEAAEQKIVPLKTRRDSDDPETPSRHNRLTYGRDRSHW